MTKIPSPSEVRLAIEYIEREDIRNFLKMEYAGALRSYELTGKICIGDSPNRKIVYGPTGEDVSVTTYTPTELTSLQLAKIINKQLTIEEAMKPVKVALFKIKIAKQPLITGEDPPFRYIALPFDEKHEPWTKELYDYFTEAGDDYVFPFTRQDVWYHISKKEKIFEDFVYPIHRYRYKQKDGLIVTILRHTRPLKTHGTRHVRIDELKKEYNFDGFDFAAYTGWSMKTTEAQSGTRTPQMLGTYAEIREHWQSYFPKLLKRTVPSFFVE